MSQKEAVFTVVTGFYGTKFQNGMDHSSDDKKKMVDLLIESHERGEWEIKSKQENLRSYVIGLLNNHLRKDTRLNGGDKYVPENPGSRTGITNPQVKALRQLRKTLADGSPEAAKVDAEIERIVGAAKAEKAKATINIDDLPEQFKSLVK